MKNVLIFCGANKGFDTEYANAATALGKLLAQQQINIITGGGSVGLMGVIADAALAEGGKVIGVIPTFLDEMEVGHKALTEMIIVNDMHERKAKMHDLCDAIIAMPGGYGTLDELFEALTWAQLDLNRKPIGLLNTKQYYSPLLQFLDHIVQEGMLKSNNRAMLQVSEKPQDLLTQMLDYQPIVETKWI